MKAQKRPDEREGYKMDVMVGLGWTRVD